MATHTVLNQSTPRVDIDELASNPALVEGLTTYDAGWAIDDLHTVGELVGSATFAADAAQANTATPALATHDRYGHRIDEVTYDESYHRVIGAAVSAGAHTSGWAQPRPGANVARAATFMLFAQVEPGHACPVSMTHSAVPVVAQHPDLAARWLPRLYSTDYDPTLSAAKGSAL
ncbi:MAG: hypothetical protein KJ548_00775, partial [Actinobacteria bacterium]|nr:hypothetical protein [Actinomycetota bacterium]